VVKNNDIKHKNLNFVSLSINVSMSGGITVCGDLVPASLVDDRHLQNVSVTSGLCDH